MTTFRQAALGLICLSSLSVSMSALAAPPLEGTLDPGFGTNGLASAAFGLSNVLFDETRGIAVSPNGRIYLAAHIGVPFQGVHRARFGLVRFHANGQLDTAFSSDGLASPTPAALANQHLITAGVVVKADGKPLVYGTRVMDGSPIMKSVVCRYAVAGNLDPGYDADGCTEPTMAIIDNGHEELRTALELPDGRLLLGGGASSNPMDPTQAHAFLFMLDANGAVDPSFGTGGHLLFRPPGSLVAVAGDIVRLADGRFLVIGITSEGVFVARVTAAGAVDVSFGTGGYVTISFDDQHTLQSARDFFQAGAVDSAGRIYVCGYVAGQVAQSSQSLLAFARLTPNGLLDLTFAGDGRLVRPFIDVYPISRAVDCAIDNRDRLVAAVEAGTNAPTNLDFGAIRLLPNGTPDPAFNLSGQIHVPINLGGGGVGHDPVAGLALVGEYVLVGGTSYPVNANANQSVGEVHTMIRLGPDRPFADSFEGN